MRTLHFWCDRENNVLVQGVNAANALQDIVVTQSDTLQIVVHNLQRNPEVPALTPYVEKPLEFDTIRFAIGYVDAAPRAGSFRLKVGDQTTAQLNWPADLSTAQLIAAWKASVLAALKALSNVADGDIVAVDPVGTPAHFFYFQWTDPEKTTPIEVVSLKLIPWIEAEVLAGLSSAGTTQLVKLTQFPLAMTDNFARPDPPAAVIIETRAGSAGTNAEQTLVIPAGAMGSVSLQWSGASTRTMAVDTLTAAGLSAALNEIVTGGDITPSFTVEQRATREGARFAIGFVGPLAGAAQSLLGRTMHDQEARGFATGTLDLREHLGIEQALNGAESVKLTLELVIDRGGDETFLREVTVLNDMTAASTPASAEASGAVAVVEKTIYLDSGLGTPFAEAAPGMSFVPTEDGAALVINHGLNTWRPGVRITLHEVNHTIFAADPSDLAAALTGSRELDDVEFTAHATSASVVHIALPWALVNDPTSAFDYRLLAVDVYSPDSQLAAYPHLHDWDSILDGLPSGQTLRAKLAALDAALTGLVGGLKLTPDKLDMVALSRSLISLLSTDSTVKALFTTLLTSVVSDSELIRTISRELSKYSEFTDAVKKTFESTELVTALVTALKGNAEYMTELRKTVFDAVQAQVSGGAVLDDVITFLVPDTDITLPSAEFSDQGDDGFFALPAAQFTVTNDGNITGRLPNASSALKGHYRTVDTKAWTAGRAREFADGDIVFCAGKEWFAGVLDGGGLFTTDFDIEFPLVEVNAAELVDDTRFQWLGALQRSQIGNCKGRVLLTVQVGHFSAESGAGNINAAVWDATILSRELQLSAVGVVANLGYTVDRTALTCATTNASTSVTTASTATLSAGMTVLGTGVPAGTTIASITNGTTFVLSAAATASGSPKLSFLAATKTLYTVTDAATPPLYADFILRARLSRYDAENVPNPRGLVKFSMKAVKASIIKI